MLANAKNQSQQFWGNLSKGQKITFATALGLFIIGTLVLSVSMLQTDYTEVARDLDPRDASEIAEMIEDMGVSYQIEDGGSRILVPEDDHDQVRLELAGAGLPRGGVLGYEELDTQQLGLTESEREMRQKIALEGELVRTIRRYPEVEDARVHLVLPERSIFEETREDSQAAVFLDLEPHRELTEQQISSIVNLVAHSVEGLTPKNVTLTSGDRMLSDKTQSDDKNSPSAGSEVEKRLSIQEEFQNTLQSSVESMLENIVGRGNVTARVNAELDFDEFESFSELFEPVEGDEGILVSMHREEEFYSGEDVSQGGVPGDPAEGTPEYQEVTGEGGSFDYERIDETRNYEVNKIEERSRLAPGALNKLSVAVAVNQELDEDEMDSIEALVEDAVGINLENENHQITVEQMDFDTSLQDMLAAQHEKKQQMAAQQRWITLGIGAAVLVVLALIGRKIYKTIRDRKEIEDRLEREQMVQDQAAASEDIEPEVPKVQKQISDFAEKKPEEFAKVLKAWLAEE